MKNVLIYMILLLSLLDETFSGLSRVPLPNCPNLSIKNGKVKKRQRGRFVKFICNPGFLLAGEKFSTCSFGGRWDPLPPKCVRPTCLNKVNPPANGLIYPTHNGAVAHVYCKAGYHINGPQEVHCDGRKWDNQMPVCLLANTKPKLFCDFETEDICGWSHDLNHDFDWRRESYKTPSGSIGTGPSFDHTKGPGRDGYYMYIESSGRNENDTARLISPIFEKTDTDTCLEFFYHMFGATTGSLRVYVKTVGESWELDPNSAIFSKKGNQGDKWFRSYHPLGVISDEYQIIIEGVRGHSYVSDIAIDDVKVIENCVYEEITTTTETEHGTEAFLTLDSCENKCGRTDNGNESLRITCDCDEDCYDNNRCCPDYFDFCVSGFVTGTTDDYLSTTDMPNEVIVTTLQASRASTEAPIMPAKNRPTTSVPEISISTTSTTRTKPTTTRATTTTTKAPTRPHWQSTVKTTIAPKTTKKIINVTRPMLHFLTQPTQPVIVQKVVPSIPVKPRNRTQIINIKPNKVDNTKEVNSNDVLDVPLQTNSDEELLLTSPFPDKTVKVSWPPRDPQDPLDSPFLGNFSEKDKFLSMRPPASTAGYNVVLVVISVVGLTILTTVIAVILVRRFRNRHRRMASCNGDSQSDVRFLTSDEVLDFSLDKNYDSL
ncbi:uncharacterized protein LOC108904074 isoform X2 [Anoplophora glabripennis]|uniref:uncharacterized protein LOC108904074 isoform X2 n=1 Tax=Anoplophora glabripennis TaxID=217634 RepID=UPI0008744FB2|nr:uncharacterized protein LOC108904074 isoform X2 [Anoplophora glabripennis]